MAYAHNFFYFLKNSRWPYGCHFDDILLTFLYDTTCNWKMAFDHHLIYCSEVVHNEEVYVSGRLFENMSLYIILMCCIVKAVDDILSWFMYVTTCIWKVVWDYELLYCIDVVHNGGLKHMKYFFRSWDTCSWIAIILVIFYLSFCNWKAFSSLSNDT